MKVVDSGLSYKDELLRSVDPAKVRPVTFKFKEMTDKEFDKHRAAGLSDEEICRLAKVA